MCSRIYVVLIFFPRTGPKQNNVSEFWCMVWQEDIDQIIMLTNLKEGRKVKIDFVKKYNEFFVLKDCVNVIYYSHFS